MKGSARQTGDSFISLLRSKRSQLQGVREGGNVPCHATPCEGGREGGREGAGTCSYRVIVCNEYAHSQIQHWAFKASNRIHTER